MVSLLVSTRETAGDMLKWNHRWHGKGNRYSALVTVFSDCRCKISKALHRF